MFHLKKMDLSHPSPPPPPLQKKMALPTSLNTKKEFRIINTKINSHLTDNYFVKLGLTATEQITIHEIKISHFTFRRKKRPIMGHKILLPSKTWFTLV